MSDGRRGYGCVVKSSSHIQVTSIDDATLHTIMRFAGVPLEAATSSSTSFLTCLRLPLRSMDTLSSEPSSAAGRAGGVAQPNEALQDVCFVVAEASAPGCRSVPDPTPVESGMSERESAGPRGSEASTPATPADQMVPRTWRGLSGPSRLRQHAVCSPVGAARVRLRRDGTAANARSGPESPADPPRGLGLSTHHLHHTSRSPRADNGNTRFDTEERRIGSLTSVEGSQKARDEALRGNSDEC
ncbi:hypothetical protein EYF80_050400 [Liparis tanakae]|uniref:Uncharacterized protein n=1 Tax=Liparis tanakae TaxID=230148 RepID=A0A4Z2FDX3_9TELE|nr:hypothetical protein EYF80_050400 [Liparis tanakae]